MVIFSSSSIYNNLYNVYFLYYSWIELRSCKLGKLSYKPVSMKWFIRISFLLKEGYSFYNTPFRIKKNFFTSRGYFFSSYRSKIYENAIFNLILPFFYFYFNYEKSFLLKRFCVR